MKTIEIDDEVYAYLQSGCVGWLQFCLCLLCCSWSDTFIQMDF